ncbi:MAG TPA: carboxypeptidase-like regulatory domain-containing protein, partial [Vicinamibacterales bacterium]|nr:carboxypeptidase-like regulatory domain-containing protein [Vicinamibacterales bacterium]
MCHGRVLASLILLLVAATAGAQTVVTGRVLAADGGDPVVAVPVAAMTVDAAGKTTVIATSETDDRGEYRIGKLPVKPMVIGVTTLAAVGNRRPQGGQPRVTYYPAASAPRDAQVLRLNPGEVRPDIDIIVAADRLDGAAESLFLGRFLPREPSLPVRGGLAAVPATPSGSVRGQVRTTTGAPVPRAQVFLFAEHREDTRATVTNDDGRYELAPVANGRVLLCVIKPGYAQVERGAQVAPFVRNRASTSPTPNDARYGR